MGFSKYSEDNLSLIEERTSICDYESYGEANRYAVPGRRRNFYDNPAPKSKMDNKKIQNKRRNKNDNKAQH